MGQRNPLQVKVKNVRKTSKLVSHLVYVNRRAVLLQELLRLDHVKLCRLRQEVVLEILLVHRPGIDPQPHEHGARVLDGQPVDHLAPTLLADHVEQGGAEVVADVAIST